MVEYCAYVGLNVHKETISVAVALAGREDPVFRGEIRNQRSSLRRLIGRLSPDGEVISFCYEAGPCGYGVYREIASTGHHCEVVAQSLIPRRAGDRVKTDRRDAVKLAGLHRAGALTSVCAPLPLEFATGGRGLDIWCGTGHGYRNGGSWNLQGAQVLGAGVPVAAGRGRGAGGGTVPAGDGIAGRSRTVAGDAADAGGIAGPGRALRPAAGARMPARVAARLPARGTVGLDRARRGHRGGVGGGGAARSGRDRALCGGSQPARVGGLMVARAPRRKVDGGGRRGTRQ